ncbi:MAG: hypothetical protein LBK67_02005, partial [Coriobacteriales bacterium]|nr:hypothetical protein [Coriobacteriales bacterium]
MADDGHSAGEGITNGAVALNEMSECLYLGWVSIGFQLDAYSYFGKILLCRMWVSIYGFTPLNWACSHRSLYSEAILGNALHDP